MTSIGKTQTRCAVIRCLRTPPKRTRLAPAGPLMLCRDGAGRVLEVLPCVACGRAVDSAVVDVAAAHPPLLAA